MVRSAIETDTAVWVVPEKAPMNRPRNWLLPESVLLLPKTVTFLATVGRSPLVSVMVPTPLLMMMLLLAPPLALRSMMAWRSEPAPLSELLLTMKSAAQTDRATGRSPSAGQPSAGPTPAMYALSLPLPAAIPSTPNFCGQPRAF